AGELPRPVPGDLAPAVDVDDGGSGDGLPAVPLAGALARRVDGLVLEQQHRVGDEVGDAALVESLLEVPALLVRDRVVTEPREDELTHTSHLKAWDTRRSLPGDAAHPTGKEVE